MMMLWLQLHWDFSFIMLEMFTNHSIQLQELIMTIQKVILEVIQFIYLVTRELMSFMLYGIPWFMNLKDMKHFLILKPNGINLV